MKHGQTCEEIRSRFLDGLSADAAAHLDQCAECARAWIGFKQTMSTLDAWTVPEPSPYFQTRLWARLEEIKAEEAARAQGIFALLRFRWLGVPVWRPAAVAALAAALAVGLNLTDSTESKLGKGNTVVSQDTQPGRGSAVGDLQVLESHQETISDLDLLDDLPVYSASASSTQDKI
ncbi:MAG: zf-HC2 domain-containing protein [Acidobacteriales bacterium]|nr:zf-HC2 domain-containing protein [Terriglobales bacterium]